MQKNLKKSLLLWATFVLCLTTVRAGLTDLQLSPVPSPVGQILTFDLKSQSVADRFTDIAFNTPGNDFGGGAFWLPSESLATPAVVSLNSKTKTCLKQVRGMYYNPQRGNAIWPLDQATLLALKSQTSGYDDLTMDGGLYTTCSGSGTTVGDTSDVYSLYGQINYHLKGENTQLVAGTQIAFTGNTMAPAFAESLQYFNNASPVGFLYDSVGGVGFVGGAMSGTGCYSSLAWALSGNRTSINSSFVTSGTYLKYGQTCTTAGVTAPKTTARQIAIEGLVGLSSALSVDEQRAAQGNINQTANIISASSFDAGSLVNIVKKNVANLCRGQQIYTSDTIGSNPPATSSVVCIQNDSYDPLHRVTIDLTNPNWLNKSIVVQNADVILTNTMANSTADSLQLFVSKGNVLLSNSLPSPTSINARGFTDGTSVTDGMMIRGVLVVEGLIAGYDGKTIAPFTHKLYIHGKVSSFNQPVQPSQGRITQLKTLFDNTYDYTAYINLQNDFTWRCDLVTGQGADGASCASAADKYAQAPFVLIDDTINSKLLMTTTK